MKKIAPKSTPLTDNTKFVVDVAIEDIWQNSTFDATAIAQKIVPLTLVAAQFDAPTEVSILLTDDKTVRALNLQYRGKDKATNVLSFPMDAQTLGDIVVAHETMTAEATAMNVSPQDHFTHLLVHGILHLLGYDHEVEGDAEAMEKLEISILWDLGIENPYSRPNFMA